MTSPVCAVPGVRSASPGATRGADASCVVVGVAASLHATVGRLARGPYDPTTRRVGRTWWRASRTPEGGALTELAPCGADVEVRSFGPGAEWAVGQAPRLLGVHDHPEEFHPDHPRLAGWAHLHPELQVGATDLVAEVLLPTVLEQRVTSEEAYRAHRLLTLRAATPAPGPAQIDDHPAHGLVLPLSCEQWLSVPSWEFLHAGVERRRASALLTAAARGASLERIARLPDPDAALRSLPGIGPWTAARVRQVALGDPDAWSVGDYLVPHAISLTLLGREALDDAEVDAALAPFAGHRYRVEQLVLLEGRVPERHGPRRPIPQHLPWRSR